MNSVRVGQCLVIYGHATKQLTKGTVISVGKRRSWVTFKVDYYDDGDFLFTRNDVKRFRNSRIIMLEGEEDES